MDTAAFSIEPASRDAEPDQLHDAQRARIDLNSSIQHDRGSHRRLEDDAPGDAELGAQGVGAGGKDDAADGCVGKCTGQAGAVAHRRGPRRIWRRRGRRGRRCPAPRAHHRDERRWRARQAAAEPHAIQLRRAEGDVPHQQVLHLAREHRIGRPSALAHVEVGAAHRQREAHRRRRRDARTVPVDLGGPVGVGEARTRLHDRDVSPHVCGE